MGRTLNMKTMEFGGKHDSPVMDSILDMVLSATVFHTPRRSGVEMIKEQPACYVVARLDVKTLKVTDVGFYSSPAIGLTYTGFDICYVDVFQRIGKSYDAAWRETINLLLGRECPTIWRWIRPWAKAVKKRNAEMLNTVVTGKV